MSDSPIRHVQQLFDLKGRIALVTGGSRGLGLQMAHALAEAGAKLVISSRKEADLDEAAAELRAAGHDVTPIVANLAKDDEVMALAQQAIQALGHIDILVNNAGATWGAPAEDYPMDGWDKVMTLNVRNLFLLTREVASKSMIPRHYGRIINIASNAAIGGNRDLMTAIGYNTSKGAVVTYTRALAAEWGIHGITVNAIGPGYFPSKMSKGLREQHGDDGLIRNVPLGQTGDDEALKGATVMFASDASKHTTGQVLYIDGGCSAMISG
ncbi:SDR family oxidoreductase [Alcanivorax sp. ZXX171]|nr:SDR family oxidoreductase [Alcanivorax sp. ZXX171]